MSDRAKILLVDDEPGMLRYIRTLLEVDNHTVQTASTGEEALELVEKGLQPNLVLLDLLMPGIDGLETLERLRKLQPNVRVVMLSCVNDTKKVVQAIRLGATDYITKPFQKAELDTVIDQCLGTNQQNYAGEVEDLGDETFFVAACANMRARVNLPTPREPVKSNAWGTRLLRRAPRSAVTIRWLPRNSENPIR